MISVLFLRGPGGIRGFAASGHALAGRHGSDVVCAAVSMAAQSAVLGLAQHLGLAVRVSRRPGELTCELPPDVPQEQWGRAQAILETMRLGILDVARQHPERVAVRDLRGEPVVSRC